LPYTWFLKKGCQKKGDKNDDKIITRYFH